MKIRAGLVAKAVLTVRRRHSKRKKSGAATGIFLEVKKVEGTAQTKSVLRKKKMGEKQMHGQDSRVVCVCKGL